MVDAAKVVAAVDKTYNDIQSVKTRMMGVTGTLNQLKVAVATALPAGTSNQGAQINLGFVRQELAKAKEAVAKFKEAVQAAVDSGGAAAGGGARRMMKDDKSRTLYERVGGDLNIETAVEIMFAKSLLDPRVRSFFEKNQRKMQQIRKKVYQFLSGFLGGPKLYDTTNVKPAHYHMNITDYHFDALMDLYAVALGELGIHADACKDFLAALGRVRKDITTGCTVRMELAQKNMEKGKDGLFKRLGGEEGISHFMERFFDIVVVDNRIRGFFQGKDIKAIREGARVYFTEALGGPKIYKGRDLAEIHKAQGVTDYDFDCFLAGMEKALSGLGVEDETIDEVIVTMEPVRPALLGRARGLAAHAKMKDGQTVLERIGGDMNVEAIVDTMFVGLLSDARVRFFFEQSREKIDIMKRSFAALAVGGFGGPVTVDDRKVRKVHYTLNVTDYHFDTMMENFWYACDLMEVDAETISDASDVLGKVRADVTAGCTVRLEVARKKSESAGTDGLFEALGGAQGISAFINKHFENIQADPRIMHFFTGAKLEGMKAPVETFMAALFGGPVQYSGRPLARIHTTMAMSDYEFDSFLDSVKMALRAVGGDSQTVDECVVLLETVRQEVLVNRKRHDVRKAMEAASTKTVFERVGGESGITTFVEAMYSKAMEDVRVKSFFEKNKAKVSSIKKKLVHFFSLQFGGQSTYDIDDVRAMHYGYNISDYHFDCLLDIIGAALEEQGVKKKDLAEILILLQPIRADVTTGFTVRMEVARKNVEKGKDQLFKRLGGSDGISSLMDALYKIALVDNRIKDLLLRDPERIKNGQAVYITEMLGGPKQYKGREIAAIHKDLGINDYDFDCYMGDLNRAMMGAGHPESLIDEVLVALEPIRADVLGHSRDAMDGVVMKDGQCLLDRFGGDQNVEATVENMFDRCVEDPRVRFHFERAKAKQRQIRRKFCNYLTGCFGGQVTYDIAELRPAHYNGNITDYHFDAMVDLFKTACFHMGVEQVAMYDAVILLNRSRADITTGCAVRMELAKKKNQLEGADQLFQRLGGLEGMMSVMDRQFECIERDKRLNMFFEGTKMNAIKRSVTDYLIMTLGGPSDYIGRPLAEAHAVLQITDYHFDCFMQDLQRAMRDIGSDGETVDEATVVLELTRKQVLKVHYGN